MVKEGGLRRQKEERIGEKEKKGVTLVGIRKETGDRHHRMGQGALIGVSVTILGNIKVGKGAMIGADSLVMKDVPLHSMVIGIPTKVIGYVDEQDPSLNMKHGIFCFSSSIVFSLETGSIAFSLDLLLSLGSPMMLHESRRHNNVVDKLAKHGQKLTLSSCFETENLSFVGGDMFQSFPYADAILLKLVMHNWSDEDCVKILQRCREASTYNDEGRKGKVLIIDMVLNRDEDEADMI
ncbi:putative serine acetyltransferase 2 [Capsicum baccatum]|uniref:Serine acetyltransferase 2 n=1 Tax=Capsicum baccatum TaxID=33114 RepID=A0A2G2W0Q1_CAPBA|nr:putative serine acetyltransferase 2 [Capsicum baccatum]